MSSRDRFAAFSHSTVGTSTPRISLRWIGDRLGMFALMMQIARPNAAPVITALYPR
jgi:hypothetical protein